MITVIIPIRSGSKRLKNKNFKKIGKKQLPLFLYTVNIIKNNIKYYEEDIKIIITTDVPDKVSKYVKDVTIHKRSEELSSDVATGNDVILDVLNTYNDVDKFLYLQPTSPLRRKEHVKKAISIVNKKYNAVSFNETSPLYWQTDLKTIGIFNPTNKRSQDYTKNYEINGAVYGSNFLLFTKFRHFFINVKPVIMEKMYSIDIDTEKDFLFADIVLKGLGE